MPRATQEQLDDFANELSVCMETAGISRRDLADAFNLTTQAIDNYVTGKREPDPRMVEALEDFLGAQGRLSPKLGYGITRRRRSFQLPPEEIQIAASGVDLEELRQRDPEAYEAIVTQARIALDRARERRRKR